MARHRGVRNRQFSYDEDDHEFYDEAEEDKACEEYRQNMLNARGDGNNRGSGGISLSSYFDIPGTVTHQLQQTSTGPPGDRGYTENDPPEFTDRHPPDRAPAATNADEELVDAIAAELESRLGKGRFPAQQVRQAVMASEYEVDTAEAILVSEAQVKFPPPQLPAAASAHTDATGVAAAAKIVAPTAGLRSDLGIAAGAGAGKPDCSSPSSLAFGLCVDGQGEWRRKGAAVAKGLAGGHLATPHSLGPTARGGGGGDGNGRATLLEGAAGVAAGVEPFGFDTPSPDDLNLLKQASARGGGSIGENQNGRGGGRKPDLDASPKAKVVHISGSTPKSVARKSLASTPTSRGDQALSVKDRVAQSPQLAQPGEATGGRAVASAGAQAEREGDASDEGEGGGKERLAMVVIGHVDAGKSTLMGQVLVQMGQVSQRVLHKQEKEAREAGKASFFLAWVMDEDQEERAHGVTIDVAQKYIETETKLVTLLDAPGHRDFIPKMISGASAADAAVLVIPAAVGEFESGFQANGQTKEHAMLAKALGVNQLLVVVNKLDATDPPWSQERYEAVKAEVGPFLTQTGFRQKKVRFVPASGLSAENVSKRTPDGALCAWYNGPTLLEAIDSFTAAPRAMDKPFRMCIADVTSSGKGVSVSGRVVQGRVRAGDKVLVMPLEDPATAARLERNGAPVRGARAGDNAEVVLSGVDPSRVVVGNVVCKAGGALPAVRRFIAQIVALPALEVPVIKGTEFQLHMHNLDVMVHCSKLISLTNTIGSVLKARPRCIPSGSTAHIRITCKRPICLEKYGDCRALGRFVLRQKGATVAVGLVLDTDLA